MQSELIDLLDLIVHECVVPHYELNKSLIKIRSLATEAKEVLCSKESAVVSVDAPPPSSIGTTSGAPITGSRS